MRYSVHQVLYYDNITGLPQIGHFVTNETNEADQTFFPNEDTEDMLRVSGETRHVLTFCGMADFMGKIPRVLAN